MHSHPPLPLQRPDSPSHILKHNSNSLHQHLASAPESLYIPQNTHHNMYNNLHIQSEYSDADVQSKVNGFGSAAGAQYRTSTAFNAFTNSRMRNQHNANPSVQYRDTPQSSFTHSYPTAADVFPVQAITSPTQQQQSSGSHGFDIHHGRGGFDFGAGNGNQNGGSAQMNGHSKPNQFGVDHYGSSSTLLQHQVSGMKSNQPVGPPGIHQQQSQHQASLEGYQPVPYLNGLHLQSQTPYGPHLQAPGPSNAVPTSVSGSASANGSGMAHINGATGNGPQGTAQEEISTIFVVGFPEDMQEREFQNMFTFSAGFEAATLKIPNKEYTAYGGPGAVNAPPATGPGALPLRQNGMTFSQYGAGSNDPYNLVTVNQGGVVVDGGRDGTTASWPALPAVQDPIMDTAGHFGITGHGQNAMPPRKQIIGFAKFRSRQEALDARDVLQGRRVDIEKGAVLKAEMAKKNLHTKRGVGLMGVGVGAGAAGMGSVIGTTTNGGTGAGGMSGDALAALTLNGTMAGGGEVMSAREKELGTLGVMGFGGLSQWREPRSAFPENSNSREEEERERRREREVGALNAMGFGGTTRGPRERAEEDEREREKRRKEKEARLRNSNSSAFDAFHSVPSQGISRVASTNSLLSPTLPNAIAASENGSAIMGGSSPMLGGSFAPQQQHSPNLQAQEEIASGNMIGHWDLRGPASGRLPQHPASSSRPSSPFSGDAFSLPIYKNVSATPSSQGHRLTRPQSPQGEGLHQHQYYPNASVGLVTTTSSSVPASSASSNAGESQNSGSIDAEIARSMGDLNVSTGNPGDTSPQLPSPGSSGSSGGAKANAVDQNPPINTLYVGNLPTSQVPPGYPANYLEDSLRDLFQRRPGYRKLCFRQKSNGPMCFVEFEDVSFAAKALNDLYGNTLNGLIKGGGIRLSYSKNPLGVRTPTSAAGNGPSLQQQQQHNNAMQQELTSPFPPDAFQSRHQQGDSDSRMNARRDLSGATSPLPYAYASSPPPPRFFSPPPLSSSFGNAMSDSMPSFSRVNHGFGFSPPSAHSTMTSFSPFGISSPPHSHSNIPEHSSEAQESHFPAPSRMLSPPANIA